MHEPNPACHRHVLSHVMKTHAVDGKRMCLCYSLYLERDVVDAQRHLGLLELAQGLIHVLEQHWQQCRVPAGSRLCINCSGCLSVPGKTLRHSTYKHAAGDRGWNSLIQWQSLQACHHIGICARQLQTWTHQSLATNSTSSPGPKGRALTASIAALLKRAKRLWLSM